MPLIGDNGNWVSGVLSELFRLIDPGDSRIGLQILEQSLKPVGDHILFGPGFFYVLFINLNGHDQFLILCKKLNPVAVILVINNLALNASISLHDRPIEYFLRFSYLLILNHEIPPFPV